MKTYIERAAVHELVKGLPKYQMFNYDRTESMIGINPDDVDFGMDKIPAADVVEVKHGRWTFKECDKMPWCTQAICSECGAVVENNSSLTTEGGKKYFLKDNQHCRKCGACMDKEDEHEAG